jgi:N-acetyl-anhydromuramyl-L-alanine amidase AmpD
MSQNENALPNGIFYPDAIKFHKGKKMRVRGKYPQGFPLGAVIHSTDGRPNDGADSTAFAVSENLYAYFVIGRGGKVFQSFSLTDWGEHAGPTLHPVLGGSLSKKLVGIEVVSAGKLVKISDDRFRPWYNEETKKAQDDFKADEVRFRGTVGSPTKVGYQTAGHYHKFTEEQETALIKLLRWLKQQKPDIFKYENVLGHDEVAVKEGHYGRKTDPGACLSMTMAQFRELLQNDE